LHFRRAVLVNQTPHGLTQVKVDTRHLTAPIGDITLGRNLIDGCRVRRMDR
jgi:hypothetical protein